MTFDIQVQPQSCLPQAEVLQIQAVRKTTAHLTAVKCAELRNAAQCRFNSHQGDTLHGLMIDDFIIHDSPESHLIFISLCILL